MKRFKTYKFTDYILIPQLGIGKFKSTRNGFSYRYIVVAWLYWLWELKFNHKNKDLP